MVRLAHLIPLGTVFLLFSNTVVQATSVVLDRGTFVGYSHGSIDTYLGIPYAKQPIGNLRYRQPEANDPYIGIYNATAFGPSCPQVSEATPTGAEGADLTDLTQLLIATFPTPEVTIAEDCLRINIWAPRGTKAGDDLPVVVWLHPGAFVFGEAGPYNGTAIVERSVQNGRPILYVNLNYRLAAFGFLPGREAKEAGITNLGLRDQRQAFHWLQQYIRSFGGDPRRVTIWGLNAGSESVGLHMLTNGGNNEGLFSGAVMQSGFPLPLNNYTQLQSTYDAYVSAANCSGTPDTLECLRQAPLQTLLTAMDTIPPETLTEGWEVIVDGEFIPEQPTTLLMKGSVARVPYIIADTDDEGTETALFFTAIDTDEAVRSWIVTEALPGISDADVDQILTLYPNDPAQGSPFNTGAINEIFPHFMQLSAIEGDLEFQGLRRFFLNHTWNYQPSWTYLSKLFKDLPGIGAGTSTDLLNLYGPGDLTDYLINFVALGNPNNGTGVVWPQWKATSPKILTIANDSVPLTIIDDTFREEGINLLISLLLQNPQ
ncbi:alpha/beta-hydrolase [Obba rivulosa]|uniref:Alpha/beta-hydrolase n=1 Tax=Obba rivulosa TaxID=1052685 RepID=A0A8E2B261_9APHY|nr:alpha/beta-hydrolase [Obba rivulosa]